MGASWFLCLVVVDFLALSNVTITDLHRVHPQPSVLITPDKKSTVRAGKELETFEEVALPFRTFNHQ
jgi:hypothetical protein